jgi:gas vesicle protein
MGKFLRTLLLGIGIGLLIAPKRGEETRQLLTQRFQQLSNSLQGGASQSKSTSSTTGTGTTSDADSQLKPFAGAAEQHSRMYTPPTGTGTYEPSYPEYVNPEQ